MQNKQQIILVVHISLLVGIFGVLKSLLVTAVSFNFEYYSDFNSTWDGETDEVSKGELQSVRNNCFFSQNHHHNLHHHCHQYQHHHHHHHHNHCFFLSYFHNSIYCGCTKSTKYSLILLRWRVKWMWGKGQSQFPPCPRGSHWTYLSPWRLALGSGWRIKTTMLRSQICIQLVAVTCCNWFTSVWKEKLQLARLSCMMVSTTSPARSA